MSLKLYADKACKKPIKEIEWDSDFNIRLVTGETELIPNVAIAGQLVKVTVYVRNEGKYRFGVTKLSFPDERVKIGISQAWLMPYEPVRLTIKFKVPDEPKGEVAMKSGEIDIKGYEVRQSREQ